MYFSIATSSLIEKGDCLVIQVRTQSRQTPCDGSITNDLHPKKVFIVVDGQEEQHGK
eukprot:m.66491 g.66491  ORF g.66491 m.66491 type:complete len:57 (+) comp13593_c2_seq2:775-945(+)